MGSLLEVGTGFHPELTGRENVFLSGAILGMRKGEILRKFDEIVAFAEVEKFIDTPSSTTASECGCAWRFAVAAHLEPEILLVDEVLSVGDLEFQKKCLGKMGDVAKTGRTILFVSHNMGAVGQLCQRCFLLDKGQIALCGDADKGDCRIPQQRCHVRRYIGRPVGTFGYGESSHHVRGGLWQQWRRVLHLLHGGRSWRARGGRFGGGRGGV